MSDSQSLVTPELQQLVGRNEPARPVELSGLLVQRVLETMNVQADSWPAGVSPPYVLMAFESPVTMLDIPAVPETLVTGDEWTLHRSLLVGERLLVEGRVAALHERFGGRFGHSLVVRYAWSFTDTTGATAAEVGRTIMHYRAPDAPTRERWEAPAGAPDAGPPTTPAGPEPHLPRVEGDPLPKWTVTPSLAQVVRHCALSWNFVPIFFDPVEAHRAGLPGTIVPGPLKLALLTQYPRTRSWIGRNGVLGPLRPSPSGPHRPSHHVPRIRVTGRSRRFGLRARL